MSLTREDIEQYIRSDNRDALRGKRLAGLDLSGLDLSRMDLQESNLSHANMTKTILRHANLQRARLVRTILIEADLSDADLSESLCHGARFSPFLGAEPNLELNGFQPALLHRAILVNTDLSFAWLGGADLRQANLQSANLTGASMCQVLLQGTNLYGARPYIPALDGSYYDQTTCWPEGVDPKKTGAILV